MPAAADFQLLSLSAIHETQRQFPEVALFYHPPLFFISSSLMNNQEDGGAYGALLCHSLTNRALSRRRYVTSLLASYSHTISHPLLDAALQLHQ